ncbi:uncharacterized protein LOC100117012 isoform X2 [Nasonia vitripennis]|nr:uncharacterized protein LOC100117012 isoform X2 [Nasonia vitripennis]
MFMCTPILGKRRQREQSLDIESRVPRAIEDLRRWTSAEALGDVTVAPDCMSRILADNAMDDSQPVDHKLPSPEEQVQAVALKFPAEIVAVDVSGKGFHRMSMRRKSMHTGQESQDTVKRRSRPRRPRGKRRNTIAGTDQKEIRQAVGGEATADEPEEAQASGVSKRTPRSASTDLLGSGGSKKDSPVEKKSHFNTLKAWGRSRLKLISPKSSQQNHAHSDVNASTTSLSSIAMASRQQVVDDDIHVVEDVVMYETLTIGRRSRREVLTHERKPSSSSSTASSIQKPLALQQTNGPTTSLSKDEEPEKMSGSLATQQSRRDSVKLRESAAERRERRKASSRADEPPHSSSGNWSASSESGRASIGSETTTTTHPPRSTTTASIGTSSTSLSHARRFKGRDTSASSSVTSEGTLTPDIIQDISAVPFSDDGETSSVYSCDTEGYYTSFHVDSGLKTLREEEPPMPQSPLTKSNEVQSDPTSPMMENEYELFGRGSTSTTTSSAGTVCTTLMAPPPPERKSSLTVVAMVHGQKQNGGESPDSGHNTSSSPVESASSPACTGRSCSEFEYSESSDLEGCERIERIRSKTAINTSRIPSMCVITPPGSDDEHNHHHHRHHHKEHHHSKDQKQKKDRNASPGSVLMSATVGTSKMEVINGQDKNLYATVQTVMAPASSNNNVEKTPTEQNSNNNNINNNNNNQKISPLSGVLGKLRGVLPGRKHQQKPITAQEAGQQQHNHNNNPQPDSGDYVTIADVRNNNDKRRQDNGGLTTVRPSAGVTYANADLFRRDAEYVSLSELPKKPDSSLERRRQGARVTLDSEGKVVYSSDSLKRRKGAHTTFIPGPFVKEGPSSPAPSPLLHRAHITPRAVQRTAPDAVDGEAKPASEPTVAPQQQQQQQQQQPPQQPGKVIIRAAKSPERASSPDYVRTPSTVVGPTNATTTQRQTRQGAYVNVQGAPDEDKALLAIQPSEPVSTSACSNQQPQQHKHPQQHPQQPPPYVGPPQVHKLHEDYPYQVVHQTHQLQSQLRQNLPNANNQHQAYHHHQQHPMYAQHIVDPYQQLIYENAQNQVYSNYTEKQKMYAQQMHNPVQGYNKASQQQQFYTLPNRRPQREVILEPPRSITPDITRGLARHGALSAAHMLARQGQKAGSAEKIIAHHHGQGGYNCQADLNRKNLEQFEARCKPSAQQHQTPVDVKNRFASPLGLSALGYRFFASTIQDGLRSIPISPIGPEHTNGFKSSTPTSGVGRVAPTVAERLALQSQRCVSPNPALVQQQQQQRSDSPASLVLSPIRSTMSNEELFAAIHKSKRRLNIKDDPESLSPAGSVTSLSKGQQVVGTRHSWSPESQKVPEIPKTVLSPSATSRMDFKRLLLQQAIKAGPTRISAAEQLKLSRQQCQDAHQQQQPSSPKPSNQQIPLTKVLSPRSAWRFQTPRTDVLSSTIIEDAAAEEKAMKPSPETPSPVSTFPPPSSRRQLDLGTSSTETRDIEELKNSINDSKSQQQRSLEKREKELENRLQLEADPVKAIEHRRVSNQLARAQFLATPPSSGSAVPHKDLFSRRFRARSESPQQHNSGNNSATRDLSPPNATTNTASGEGALVARSPSAPALETAL